MNQLLKGIKRFLQTVIAAIVAVCVAALIIAVYPSQSLLFVIARIALGFFAFYVIICSSMTDEQIDSNLYFGSDL